jgi:hypothetical protein
VAISAICPNDEVRSFRDLFVLRIVTDDGIVGARPSTALRTIWAGGGDDARRLISRRDDDIVLER